MSRYEDPYPRASVLMNPLGTALVLLSGSLAMTALLWYLEFPFFFLFLLIPVVPFLRRGRQVRRCPVCGWETTGRERICPFDATPLKVPGSKAR
jgi:hypothetical protein